MKSLNEEASDAIIRVTKAVHLGTAAPDGVDDMDYDLKEWLIEEVADGLRWDLADEEVSEDEMLHEYICGVLGWDSWLIEVQTPVPFRFSEGGFAFTWGHCWIGYAAGKTYEEAVRVAIRRAEETRESERERQSAEAS